MDNGASSYRRFRDHGDETGLADLIRDYKDGLMLYLYSLTGNIQTAEDLTEDTFVLLATRKPRDHGKGSFKTWLYTIGRNVAIDHFRRVSRRKEVPLEDCPELANDLAELERSYLRQEQKIQLHRAMAGLKPEYRQILWLVYFEDLSLKQAARVLGKTVHGTEVLVSRARKALRTKLETEGYIYEEP